MNKQIENIKHFRKYLLKLTEDLSVEQLNKIPAGYNNNIIWHLAHVGCVVQNVCYVRSGLPITTEDQYFSPYMPGTKPERFIDEEEINIIKALSISSIDRLQSDYEQNVFSQHPYTPSEFIPKVYGMQITNIDEAIDYLIYHEGTHAGYVLAMKHLVS